MPAPSNDAFASAIALSTSLPGTLTGQTLVDATSETNEPFDTTIFPVPVAVQSIWYTFTPTVSGRHRFSLRNIVDESTDYPFVAISVYTGSALNALTPVHPVFSAAYLDGSYQALTLQLGFHADLVSGTTYRIQVWAPLYSDDSAEAHTFSFDLVWDEAEGAGSPPANDQVVDAILIEEDGSYPGTLKGATYNTDEGYGSSDVWYRIETGSETLTDVLFTLTSAGAPDYVPAFELLQLTGSDPTDDTGDFNFVDFASDDDDDGSASLLTNLSNDTVYYLHVTGLLWGSDAQDDFTLDVDGLAAPITGPGNDNFDSVESPFNIFDQDNPYNLNVVPGEGISLMHAAKQDGTTVGATSETNEPTHGGFGPTRSVWYLYQTPFLGGDFKIWVESSVDCVLSVYQYDPTINDLSELVSVGEDDDSGPGDQPEVTITNDDGNNWYWICVDSKTEGTFTVFVQRLSTGTPPANDDFANAEVHTKPFAAAGTTVGATGEPGEYFSSWQGVGPTDGVWYKYTPNYTGTAIIAGKCITVLQDAYVFVHVFQGTQVDDLTLVSPDSETGDGGEFFAGDDAFDNPLRFPVVSGQDYYIRVATFSGGSEDFEIYVDTYQVYLDLTPSGSEEMHGTLLDDAVVYLNLAASGTDVFHLANPVDAAEIRLRLAPIPTYEAQGQETADSGTVALLLSVLGGECYSRFRFTGSGEAYPRWSATDVLARWQVDPETRWAASVKIQPGC